MSGDRPRTYALLGMIVKFHAFPAERDGKHSLVECIVPPGLGAPPNHHDGETESFYVLDGAVEFTVAGETEVLGPGGYAMVPDGALHAFTARGDRPARMLILNAPGIMHDRFFTGIGVPVPDGTTEAPPADGPPDIPRLVAFAAELGMTIPVPERA